MRHKINLFNIIILVLSVYVLGALVVETFVELDPEIKRVLELLDYVICVFFFSDFLYQFFSAKNKWQYMKWGWLDLISNG